MKDLTFKCAEKTCSGKAEAAAAAVAADDSSAP